MLADESISLLTTGRLLKSHDMEKSLAKDHMGVSGDSRRLHYFDLPLDIRYTILETLLVRGKVPASEGTDVTLRFLPWKHPPPQWSLLKAVCR